jgi:flagellar biosynthesis/type III secretory pathway protein FliH
MIVMVERLIDSEELLLDTPFLRRLRAEGHAEGQAEGRIEGRAEGQAEGQREGQVAGVLLARRRSILDVLVVRFDPPASVYQQVERALETCTDELRLTRLLAAAVRAENVAAFQIMLEQELRSSTSA